MATIAELFATYAGWPLVPVRAGDKRPIHADWLRRSFSPEDFSEGDNVGVKLGAAPLHLVDLDLDCPEAIIAAGILAPSTRTSGRASKPRSHHWFSCPGYESRTFHDVPAQAGTGGRVLLEMRSTGQQTVIPPSVHESGEAVVWESINAHIPELTKEEVDAIGSKTAIATILGRHWPASGRHMLAGPVGGFLARLGLYALDIEHIIRAICAIAKDPEVEDRVRFARESAEKHAQGLKVTGGKTLGDVLPEGEKIVKLIFKWLGKDGDDRIEALNAIHFVTRIGSDWIVGTEEDDEIYFQSFDKFERGYWNQFIGKARLGHKWLEHPGRRSYGKLIFAPPGTKQRISPKDYNLWRGFATTPMTDNPEPYIARYLEHAYEVIANGVPLHGEYVLDLLADAVQRPGDPVGKALALRSPQGFGKSVFVEAFGKLFGRHFISVSSRNHISGQFNAHLSAKVILFADEAVWGGNKTDIGVLKHLVTQRTIAVTPKGIDTMTQPNYLHLFLATNEDWAWPAGNLERRGVVLDLQKRSSVGYFDKLWAEVQSPTFAPALLTYLQNRPVDLARLRFGLDTEGLMEQKELTASVAQQFYKQMLVEGGVPPDFEWKPEIPVQSLYESFIEAMGSTRGAGQSHRGTKAQFAKGLHALCEGLVTDRRKARVNTGFYNNPTWENKMVPCFIFPPLDSCRKSYDRIVGSRHSWPSIPEQPALPEEVGTL